MSRELGRSLAMAFAFVVAVFGIVAAAFALLERVR
jgi:hypothetical protein